MCERKTPSMVANSAQTQHLCQQYNGPTVSESRYRARLSLMYRGPLVDDLTAFLALFGGFGDGITDEQCIVGASTVLVAGGDP